MLKNALLTLSLICGAAATNPAGVAFLKANKLKEGVVELPSGLQYKVLRAGDGTDHPTVSSACECHYEGRSASNYPDGPVFDSSYARGSPTTFAPNQVIKGWVSVQGPQRRPLPPPCDFEHEPNRLPSRRQTEAMQLMVEGDKWEMYIPSDLAYGDRGRPPKIGDDSLLRACPRPQLESWEHLLRSSPLTRSLSPPVLQAVATA